jgi:hypothetical protein
MTDYAELVSALPESIGHLDLSGITSVKLKRNYSVPLFEKEGLGEVF